MAHTATGDDLPAETRLLIDFLEPSPRPVAIFQLPEEGKTWTCTESYLNPAFKRLPNAQEELEDVKKKFRDGVVFHKKLPHRQFLDDGKWEIRVSGSYRIALLAEQKPDGGIATERSSNGQPVAHVPLASKNGSTHEADQLLPARDWTRYAFPGMTPWTEYLRSVKWETTSVGPMEDWPLTLRRCVLSMMTNPDPRLIVWGESMALIYNEACMRLIGKKHPDAMGQEAAQSFAELWDNIKPLITEAYRGQPSTVKNTFLSLERDGFLEETYWNFSMLPVFGQENELGCLDEFTETTHVVTGERRRQSIGYMSQQIAQASTLPELWAGVVKGFEYIDVDAPWGLLYEVVDEDVDPAESVTSSDSAAAPHKKCNLVGSVGISQDNVELRKDFSLLDHLETGPGITMPCLKAWKNRSPVTLHAKDGTLPQLLTPAVPGRGFDAPVSRALVSPIHSSTGSEVLAILVLGLNPMCEFSGEYSLWLDITLDIISKAAALISLPQEQRRSQKIAADINQTLAHQLRMATIEAERSEAKFYRLAASAPTGMFMFDGEGGTIWVNDTYLEILGETRDNHDGPQTENYWLSVVHDEDRERFVEQWVSLKENKSPITIDYRLKKPWKSLEKSTGQEISGDRWLLATAFPELEADGKISSIQGWITDISHRKFTENLLTQRLEDALETKRQSENFIDMTSHEMRNPLSAILQSADSIVSTLGQVMILDEQLAVSRDVAEEIIDSAQTIVLCAQHQKRIVDDILTLSKLDASLLVICPDRVSPPMLVEKALKMYEGEIMRADIDASIYIEPSYDEMQIEEVVLDPSRLLQVIINLLTNSIKFTQYSETRQVQICLGASYGPPTGAHHNVNFVPVRQTTRPMHTPQPEWGPGEDIYLQVACRDTGRGLSEDEMKILFQRFQQASPKTYKQYGGSGLGLFISRELCELQGGQIGVASSDGHTVFAFFVKCKRWVPGPDDNPLSRQVSRNGLPIYPTTAASPISYSRRASIVLQPPSASPTKAGAETMRNVPPKLSRQLSREVSNVQKLAEVVEEKLEAVAQEEGRPVELHVLVVEDNLINQKVVSQQLRRAGCVVHVANHGVECLSFLDGSTFCSAKTPLSVILLDLEMPTMGGIECIKHIRERQLSGKIISHVPVIAVTANARSEQITVALDAGMDLVVTKPFRIPELMPQMATLIAEIAARKVNGMRAADSP